MLYCSRIKQLLKWCKLIEFFNYMNELTVSIIIPVYNTANYLNNCIESLINQTYNNLEIIIVNDGSTDSSKDIIDEYALEDKRIVVIHKENGGIGSAYKAAFKVMAGDYVLFVDSDDWLELNAVENLVSLAVENDADMVSFGIQAYNPQWEEVKLKSFKNIDLVNTNNEAILKTHFEVLKHPTLARLYRRDLFKNIVVFEQNIGIDEMLTPQLLAKCNRAVYTSKVLYNVMVREDSVCREEYNEKKIRDTIGVYQFLCSFIEKNAPKYKGHIELKYLSVLHELYNSAILIRGKITNNSVSEIREDFRLYIKKTKDSGNFYNEKLLSRILKNGIVYCPFVYNTFFRTYNKLKNN